MTDRPEASPWLRLLGGIFVSASLAFSPQVLAQDESGEEEDEVEATEEIVVTGSRLKRDTYSSISPLQIITGQVSREVGLIDAADILQESTAASGQQIDLTFQGFVLDNGPGATTIDLRGLGAARTLVLVNGRRLAPAGVEGAPVSPDLNLVPAALVQQYDILLDGASSVYGSDAVAGVANIILRKDFDGFEIEAYSRVPHHDNGLDNTLSAVWGQNFDRGFIGVGAEFTDRERVRIKDRPWTAGCERDVEETESGEIRTTNLFYPTVYGMEWDGCTAGLLAGRVSVPVAGSIYYTPGFQQSAGGWPEFSESNQFGFGIDGNGDGSTDLSFKDYDLIRGNSFQDSDLFPEVSTQNFMAFGEYTFAGEANITPFFEVLYARRDFSSNSAEGQLFPSVPAGNPFNICNPNGIRGVDCGVAWDALMNNPNFVQQVLDTFGCDPSSGGSCDQTFGFPFGPQSTLPIVSVRGDRNLTDVTADQTRAVLGVRGDMPFMNFGSLDNWTFEVAATYTLSTGESTRPGVRQDRLDAALGVYSLTDTPCELNDPNATGPRSGLTIDELQPDVAPGCVPVDLYAPSLYPVGSGTLTGDFATQAERDYLFDNRDFDTEYEQTIFTAYATGDIFEVPAGPVAFGIGAEYRKDEINSLPDVVASDGLLWGFFSDGGAVGEVDITELFAEVEVPIFAGTPGFQEMNINLSSRMTDHELYGENWTWSGKFGWRPTDSLLLRATYGTAFRAPNLRELYLRTQSGFLGIFDPCLIPEDALDTLTGEYIPANDDRDQEVLDNCLAQGVDPTLAQNNGFNVISTEVAAGGSLTLDPEKSTSWSAGLSWDQPFTKAFGLSLGATYYEIDIRNTIIRPSAQFIVNDCYGSLSGNSAFCERITRRVTDPQDNPNTPFITFIDQGFINRDQQQARGVDINLAFDKTFTVFERPVDFSMDVRANRQLENSTLFTDDEGNRDVDTFHGEWGYPDWTTQAFFRFDYDDFRLTWETRYLSGVEQDPRGVDDFDDINGLSDTCLGPPDDELCRDVGYTSNYFQHNMSVYYYGDRWTFGGGIRNVFDEAPPVTEEGTTTINNTPIGYGYDINGRTYFFNVAVTFGGSQ